MRTPLEHGDAATGACSARGRSARVVTVAVIALALAALGSAQVASLYYREVSRDGRIYVFNSDGRYKTFLASGEMGTAITLAGRGPDGETLIAENETALDLFLFKHDLPAYDRPAQKPAKTASAFPTVVVGGRVFADLTSRKNVDKGTRVESNDSGVGADVTRFYFNVVSDLSPMFSAKFTSDIGDQGARRYDIFVRNAFVQAKLGDAAVLRLGAADSPWVPFVDGITGQRYLKQSITDNLGFGVSGDWGLHLLGKTGGGRVSYQLSLVNGRGFSNPSRSKTIDLEGRVAVEPVAGLTLAVGGYSGKRGQDTDVNPAKHTATRWNALADWRVGPVKVGGELFTATNWNQVTKVPTDTSDGYSAWLQVAVAKDWTVFAEHWGTNPSKDLNPGLEGTYDDLGVQWKPVKAVTATLAYKHAEVKGGAIQAGQGGTIGFGSNTIGSSVPGAKGVYDEVGLWFQYDF